MIHRSRILRFVGYALLIALLGVSAFTLYLDLRVKSEFEGRRFALPARIYARPLELHAGLRIALPDVLDELRDLGYRDGTREAQSGWYALDGERLQIALRPFVFWDGAQGAKRVRVDFEGGTVK